MSHLWALTLDVESWPTFTPTMDSVVLEDGPVAVGSRARIRQPNLPALTWTVLDLQDERLFTWSTTTMGITLVASHALAAQGDTTVQTLTVDLSGRGEPIVGRLVRGRLQRAIEQENDGFARAAEHHGS